MLLIDAPSILWSSLVVWPPRATIPVESRQGRPRRTVGEEQVQHCRAWHPPVFDYSPARRARWLWWLRDSARSRDARSLTRRGEFIVAGLVSRPTTDCQCRHASNLSSRINQSWESFEMHAPGALIHVANLPWLPGCVPAYRRADPARRFGYKRGCLALFSRPPHSLPSCSTAGPPLKETSLPEREALVVGA